MDWLEAGPGAGGARERHTVYRRAGARAAWSARAGSRAPIDELDTCSECGQPTPLPRALAPARRRQA